MLLLFSLAMFSRSAHAQYPTNSQIAKDGTAISLDSNVVASSSEPASARDDER
jgi:hypothetical protein